MQKFSLEVSIKDKGLRLDQYIIKKIDIPISRSRIQSLINSENITVNQKPTKAHYKVKENDLLLVNIPPPAETKALPQQIPLNILFEDEDVLVVDKPEGMVTHPAVGHNCGTLVNALLAHTSPIDPGCLGRNTPRRCAISATIRRLRAAVAPTHHPAHS